MNAEVVVVGAGVLGASVAYHLAARGLRDVLVVDRGAEFGAGSTSKATGGFRAQFDSEVNVRLSLLAREKLRAFREEIGVDPGYRPHGYLFLATSEAELKALRLAQSVQHRCGLREAQMISAAEAHRLSPIVEDQSVIGAAFCPTDGFVAPMNMLRGYAEAARRLGVRFEFGREANIDDIEADAVVDARGAWSGAPVVAVRRNIAATEPTTLVSPSAPMTIWAGDWFHLRERDGRVLLLWPDDPPNDEAWLDEVQRRVRARAPKLAELTIAERWSGLYEMSPDEHALLGRAPHRDNLYLATGSSGHGVMHAPALGHLLAQIIAGETPDIDVSALRPDRFS